MYHEACILCGASLPQEPLLVCENMPAQAQNLPEREELDSDQKKTLMLVQCPCCGLVQFAAPPVYYYRDVIRSGGISTTMRELRREQYARFVELCRLKGKRVLEVGCGQGEFLAVWKEFPVHAFGIEHDPKLVEKAVANGLSVTVGFADDTQFPEGIYDAFCSFNFLEHQPDPRGMLRSIYDHLQPQGYGLITVPSFEYILEMESYYELIPDHIAYYTKETLTRLVEMSGFEVVEHCVVNRDTHEMIVRKRNGTNMDALVRNRDILARAIGDFLNDAQRRGERTAVWGASHQGFTLMSTTQAESSVAYIIDSAPFKQGRYAPGSHIPIVAPDYYFEHPVENILIVAPGYTDEIAQIVRSRLGHRGSLYTLRSNILEELS